MKTRNILLLLGISLLLIATSSLYLLASNPKPKTYRIIFLYYNYDTTKHAHFEAMWQYNVKATLGLEFAIEQELKNFGINYDVARFESEPQHNLNKTFLDSADLIVVGGLSYWWLYASNEAKLALFQTSTPIIASISYGRGANATLIRTLTGVLAGTEPSNLVLYGKDTLVEFTEYSQASLRNRRYFAGWAALINVNVSHAAKVYAYAISEGQKIPLLVFNGTKNFLINAFTYEGTGQYDQWELKWPKLLLIALNKLFNLVPDDVLSLRIFPRPELTALHIGNFHLILDQRFIIPIYILVLFAIFLVKYQAIKFDHNLSKLKLRVSAKQLKITMLKVQQVTLISFIALCLVDTYMKNIPLIVSTMLLQSLLTITIFAIILYISNLSYRIS